MDKEQMTNENRFEGLTASEIWRSLYNKELNVKKHVLEYIELTRILKKENAREAQLQDTYKFIYDAIEDMKESIKPNTVMYLKNTLKAQLGKYVKEKEPAPINHFIEFFKRAYPEDKRRKDFTWVLMDVSSITEEQLWTTLAYINKAILNKGLVLNKDQKKDIVDVIEIVVNRSNVKFINNIRSLKALNDMLHMQIVTVGDGFKVRRL